MILCYSDFLFYAYKDLGFSNVEYQNLPNDHQQDG